LIETPIGVPEREVVGGPVDGGVAFITLNVRLLVAVVPFAAVTSTETVFDPGVE
jgi:hypothetical protein